MDTVSAYDKKLYHSFLKFDRRRKEFARAKPISVQLDQKVISEIRNELAKHGHPKVKNLSNSYVIEFAIELFEELIVEKLPQYIKSQEMIRLTKSFKSDAMKQAAKTRALNKQKKLMENKFEGENYDNA